MDISRCMVTVPRSIILYLTWPAACQELFPKRCVCSLALLCPRTLEACIVIISHLFHKFNTAFFSSPKPPTTQGLPDGMGQVSWLLAPWLKSTVGFFSCCRLYSKWVRFLFHPLYGQSNISVYGMYCLQNPNRPIRFYVYLFGVEFTRSSNLSLGRGYSHMS